MINFKHLNNKQWSRGSLQVSLAIHGGYITDKLRSTSTKTYVSGKIKLCI